jgi:hypothetical protein
VGQHLSYADNDHANPFTCMLDSQLHLPQSWAQDRQRCRAAGIPDSVEFRTQWQIGLEQVRRAVGNGIRLPHIVFDADVQELLRIGLERWQAEKWFERARQQTGFGSFEVRTYVSLIRHWLCVRLAMLFLACQTKRLRGENPNITVEQVARVANSLAGKVWSVFQNAWTGLIQQCQ